MEYERQLFMRWMEAQMRSKASKTISNETREKMWKLYKLSVKGIGGEKQNATTMLNTMLQKNNVNLQTLIAEQKIFGKETL